jgi:type IV pilus assembly protein PilB
MIASPADIRSAIRVYYGPQDGEAVSLQPTTAPATQPEKPTTPPERKPEPPPLPPKRQKMPSMSDGAPPPTKAVPPSRPPGRSVSRPPVGPPSSPPNRPGIPEASGALPHFPSSQDDELAAELGADLDIPPPPMRDDSVDHPDASPEIEAHEHDITTPGRKGPRMVALTLLDGTSLALPARPRRRSEAPPTPLDGMSDQLTSRDLISALRALSHGADVSEILGNDVHWESMFAALLSLLLKKGIIADWEFIDELRKV